MKPLFSLNELHMTEKAGAAATRDTPAVPPKEIVVKPGTAFYALTEEDHEFFLKNNAARLATDSEARDLEPPKVKKTAAEKKAEDEAAKKAADEAAKKAADEAAAAAKKPDDDGKSLV